MRYIREKTGNVASAPSTDARVGLVASLPKSGTWSLHYFWATFDALLRGADIADPFAAFWNFRSLGLDLLGIAHFYCPGFEQHLNTDELRKWQALSPAIVGLDWGTAQIKAFGPGTDPMLNQNLRLLMIYRNPFDQMVSYHRNYRRDYLKPDYPFTVRDAAGMRVPANTLREYAFNIGLRSIIKFLLTFRAMRPVLGPRLLEVSYEAMLHDRAASLRRIVEFMSGPLTPEREGAFERALALTSLSALSAIERASGGSIADAAVISHYFSSGGEAARLAAYGERHINSAEPGRWREVWDEADVLACREAMREYGVDPDDFIYQ